MASPLVGIAGVNSLLFASYGASKRIISPFPNLSLKEIAAAGAMAGAANAILASPGTFILSFVHSPKSVSPQKPYRLFLMSAITLIVVFDVDCVQWRCLRYECRGSTVLLRIRGYGIS